MRIRDLKDVKEMYCKYRCPERKEIDPSTIFCENCDLIRQCFNNRCSAVENYKSPCDTCQIDNFIEELYQNKLIDC